MCKHRRRIIRTKVPLAEVSGWFAGVMCINPKVFSEVRRLAENAASEYYGYDGGLPAYPRYAYFVFSDEQALLAFKLMCPYTTCAVNMVPETAVFTLHTYINN